MPVRRCSPGSTVRSWSTSTTPSSKCTATPSKDLDTATPGSVACNALIATVTTEHAASVITGQRLRKGACGSARGAARMVADTLATVALLRSPQSTAQPLVRADSAFYGYPTVSAAIRGGADVSITVRLDPRSKPPSPTSPPMPGPRSNTPTLSTTNHPPVDLPSRGRRDLIHRIQLQKTTQQVQGRFVVRRIPDLNQSVATTGKRPCSTCGVSTRSSSPPTPYTVTVDKTTAATRSSSRSTLTSKAPPSLICPRSSTANAAWLVLAVIAFNLTRAAATLTGPGAGPVPHRDHPPHPDHRASTHRFLRSTTHLAPTPKLALGNKRGTPCSTTFFIEINQLIA